MQWWEACQDGPESKQPARPSGLSRPYALGKGLLRYLPGKQLFPLRERLPGGAAVLGGEPMLQLTLPSQINSALDTLDRAGYQAYLVGGCLRDYLLARPPQDFDLATDARPEQAARLFPACRVIETGLKHGTITVLLEGLPIQITTFRRESVYSDNRHPDQVVFINDVQEDLARRDFTINALAYHPERGLIDPWRGAADLRQGIIRCVGQADERFREDALRILRALRFAAALNFTLEENTKASVFGNRALLRHISPERLTGELLKLLAGPAVKGVLTEYADVLGVFIPELARLKNFDQRNRYHCYDALTHTAVVVENTPPEPPYLRLAALLHDIAKPAACELGADGYAHYYRHGEPGAVMAKEILLRLKLDRHTLERVTALVQWHDAPIRPDERSVKRWLSRLGKELFADWLLLRRADRLGHRPEYQALEKVERIGEIAREILARQDCLSLAELNIRGSDLLELGFPKGPAIGAALRRLLDLVLAGRVKNETAALRQAARSLLKTYAQR